MGGDDASGPLDAGGFSAWLAEIERAIGGEGESVVPCGTCTACCTSAQFVHIGPEETDTLAHIPAALLFPAPQRPPGHVLIGYDERGHCPMLTDGKCSIYEHRPRTCRTYDCRVFPAAGIEADKPAIAVQAKRWRFTFPTSVDEAEHAAARAAATYLANQEETLPVATGTQRAVLAIQLHRLFIDGEPAADTVRAQMERATQAR